MTTATLRQAARDAEASLNWAEAADLYAKAIAAYPRRAGPDSLAERDLSLLETRRAACERMTRH